jgi:hypothetical protein
LRGITYNHDSGKFMAVGEGGEVVEITLSPSSLPPVEPFALPAGAVD